MRNLKKLLAVILSVVMIASMMVPALAANTYEAEALKLQAINVFAGGPEDLKLDEGVTRIQGLTFAIRAAGKDDDALAMEDEEVDTILADWTDADSIPQWGRKYAAYAIKNSITVGLSATEKIFGALNPISGTSFLVFVMKSGMGYADVTTADVVEASVEAGILTAGQAIEFGQKEALIRDDAAGILYGAFTTGVNADGTKLIDAYIASGATTLEDAIEAGFAEEVVPEELEVVDVYADNLKEIVVVFNKEVDKDTLDGNFKLSPTKTTDDIDDVKLQDDGVTVVLVAKDNYENQKEYTLTIDKVKDLNGDAIAKTTVKVTPFDATLPVVDDITVTGPNSFVISFSEPMKPANGAVKVKSANTTLSTRSISAGDFDRNEVTVNLYTSLSDGKTYTIEISGFEDYAGYANIKKTIELTYEKDSTPPIASIENATQEYVEIKFNKPVKGLDKDNFYHTYTAWKSIGIYKTKEDLNNGTNAITNSNTSVSTVFVKFSDASGENYPLPAGDVEVYILGKVGSREVKDNWGNKLGDVTLIAHVTSDKTAPTVSEIEVEDGQNIKVTFDKEVQQPKSSNFEILDAEGRKISGLGISRVSLSSDKKVVTITLSKDMTGKTLQLTIKDIKDTTINQNKMDIYTTEIVIGDSVFDGIARVEYDDEDKILYVIYKEEVNDTALDINNYRVKIGSEIKKIKGTTSFHTNNKTVKIELDDEVVNDVKAAGSILLIANVEDVEGNVAFLLEKPIETIGSNKAGVKHVRAIDKNKISVQFDQELRTVDPSEFLLKIGADAAKAATGVELEVNSDGTLAVFTFDYDDFEIPANVGVGVKLNSKTFENTENFFGVAPAAIENKTPVDYIAPSVVSIVTGVNDSSYKVEEITITFDEDLHPSYVSALTWSVEGRTVKTASFGDSGSGTNKKVVILELVVDGDVVADALAAPQVIQLLDIKDNGLNGVLTAEAFNDEEYETKTPLDVAKDRAAALDKADYTPETWADLEEALDLPEETNEQVMDKVADIHAAIDALEQV